MNIDRDLQEKLEIHAKENNITVDVLLETILYDYFDELEASEEKLEYIKDEIDLASGLTDDEFNEANYDFLKRQFGM